MAFIETIEYEQAEGELKEIYDHLIAKRGKLAEVHKIQSLNPKSIMDHMELYMTIMFGKSPLKRYQREMIAVIVSATNQCPYCIKHHAEALLHFWKDEQKVNQLAVDYESVELSATDKALCDYAEKLTLEPAEIDKKLHIDQLKSLGLSDRAILDAALVTSYFNFVNRMVLGLGVHLEDDGGGGYSYE